MFRVQALKFARELTLFVLKLFEKNSSVNIRFKIFVMAFRSENFLGPSRNGSQDGNEAWF